MVGNRNKRAILALLFCLQELINILGPSSTIFLEAEVNLHDLPIVLAEKYNPLRVRRQDDPPSNLPPPCKQPLREPNCKIIMGTRFNTQAGKHWLQRTF